VIGTSATVRSQAYHKAILARSHSARVFARACPLLVPLVEEGRLRHPITRLAVEDYLAPLLRERIDTLVLGCTHYPLLKPLFRAVAGSSVRLVDSAESCAADVRERLESAELLARTRRRRGIIQPFVTDEVERFGEAARRFLGETTEHAWRVDLAS
jgi:glutamate racemase